jgi:hypothetical protein
MRTAAIRQAVNVTVAKKTQDLSEQQGEMVVQLIENAGAVAAAPQSQINITV